jgi:hypothetical protein
MVLLKPSVWMINHKVLKGIVLNFMHADIQYGCRSLVCFLGCFMPQAVMDVSPHRPEFNPRPSCLGFVVDRIALGQDFLQGILFSSVSIILSVLHIHALFIHCDAT